MKAPQEQVQYTQATGPERCGMCRHFAAPQSCEIVEGVISPDGVCMAFEPLMDAESGNAPQPMQADPNMQALEQMFAGPVTSR